MNHIHRRFSEKFRSSWVKVKFFSDDPGFSGGNFRGRFCEALKQALVSPLLLDRNSLTCPGARYAFGWDTKEADREKMLKFCPGVSNSSSLALAIPVPGRLIKKFKYVGLNFEGEPDLLISYLEPEKVMEILKVYSDKQGIGLDVSLSSVMSICEGVAVRSFIDKKISLSFGCRDSRRFAGIGMEKLAIGIPANMFNSLLELEPLVVNT